MLSRLSPLLRSSSARSAFIRRHIHIEKRLQELNIDLPAAPTPKANYSLACQSGNTLYISGHLPIKSDGNLITGRIGEGSNDVPFGYEAAKWAALNIVATLKKELVDLDRVEKIVKMFGIVQSTNDFKEQHLVMNGCSDTIMEIFDKDVGYHARSAIGTSALPFNMPIEIEAIVQIKE